MQISCLPLRRPEKRGWAGRESGRCTASASLPPFSYLDIELHNRDLRVLQHGARVSRVGGKADEQGGSSDGQVSRESGELERRDETDGGGQRARALAAGRAIDFQRETAFPF
jgi:hypothetical protein